MTILSSHPVSVNDLPPEERPKAQVEPKDDDPDMLKSWGIHDPFQFAPPRPDGNSWTFMLNLLLKRDQMQCDAWKDEVQNLHIFAGLFSAVVTAFIIESYKTLQPNPSDIMINLLSKYHNMFRQPFESKSYVYAFNQSITPVFSNCIVHPSQ